MKWLVFLLFPLIAFSQVSYKDIMSISSKDAFIKLMVDNKYSAIDSGVSELSFAFNPVKGDEGQDQSVSFAYFYPVTNTYEFEFGRTGTNTNMYTGAVVSEGIVANTYDPMLRKVKRKCDYVEIKTIGKRNYAIYNCDKAEFDGLIGLTTSGQSGIVKTFNR
jgi:hypothetical protein